MEITRRAFVVAGFAAGAAATTAVSGCSSPSSSSVASSSAASTSASFASSASSAAPASAISGKKITIGTLAAEDILPFWVASDQGLFADNGLNAEVVIFQSATELIAGIASGEVDLAMTDIMVAASLFASGTDIALEWVTLGATPVKGHFGIMVGPDSKVETLGDLAGVPIGVGSNTLLEYVMDQLMEGVGVASSDISVEELQKLPVRYQAMVSGEVEAAVLPGTFLALGEANGCRLIADDTKAGNISQSVMIARSDFVAEDDGARMVEQLEDVWDDAVALINANPEDYRAILVENANLPEVIAQTYAISEYPACELPTEDMVRPVLAWMQDKGYLTRELSYNEATGRFSSA